jgi:hypothetical protein
MTQIEIEIETNPSRHPIPVSHSPSRRRQSPSAAPSSLNVSLAGQRRGRSRPVSLGVSRSSAYLAGRMCGAIGLLLLPALSGKVRRDLAVPAPPGRRRRRGRSRLLGERLRKGMRVLARRGRDLDGLVQPHLVLSQGRTGAQGDYAASSPLERVSNSSFLYVFIWCSIRFWNSSRPTMRALCKRSFFVSLSQFSPLLSSDCHHVSSLCKIVQQEHKENMVYLFE